MHLEKDQPRGSFTIASAFHLRNGPVLGTTAAPPLKTGVKLCIAITATARFAEHGFDPIVVRPENLAHARGFLAFACR
jgi:hypothetical protein